MEKRKLNSASYIIAYNFLHNMHRVVLFSQPRSQATRATRLYAFSFFGQRQIYCWYLYFDVQTPYLLYSVAWVGAISNMCDHCRFLTFAGIPHALSFVYELLINPLANFFKNP